MLDASHVESVSLSLRLYNGLLEVAPLLLILGVAVPYTLHVLIRVNLTAEKWCLKEIPAAS
jgi:hypothetical protein